MKAASKEPSKPVEDESLKKNTDCVYFLASPLTCKKGNECEYRHSEEARMNPRDCWFWLNGNCLNPKCAFRHPPLDGLVGTPLATSAKPSIPLSLPVASAQLPVVKQGTPCYYFQKGQCLKGDRCAFMHGSQPIDRVPPHPPASKTTSGIEPQTLKKPQWSLKNCNQQKNVPRQNVIKPIGVQTSLRPPMKNVAAPFTNGIVAEKNMPPISLNSDILGYKATNAPSIISGNFVSRTQYGPQSHVLYDRNFQSKKEPGEFLGKTSPGFDTLVDAKLHKSDYYEEDHFGRTRGDVGRHLNTANVIDYGRSAEYNPATKFDRETYSDSQGYDTYGKAQDRYVQKPRKASSKRILDRPYLSESRGYSRVESPEQIDGLDLRHRLSKQRRTNGSRSDVSPDSDRDLHRVDDRVRHVENQRYQGRDSHYLHQESPRSSRLQGRISLPGRSSPDRNRNDFHAQETERKRSSPARASVSSFTGIPRDSTRRVGDEVNAEGRSFRTPFIRREDEEQPTRGIAAFSGDGKNSKVRKFESSQELEDPSSFEGPKPLREILKRKRQEKTVVPDDSTAYGGREGMYLNEGEGNSLTVASDKKSDNPSNMKEEINNRDSSKEEHRFDNTNSNGTLDDEHEEEEGVITEEAEDQPSAQRGNELKAEDTMMLDNAEDGEYETFDQKDGESDFGEVDGDFKTEEDGYQDLEEEEEECDDDGDDFAKRIGVMFS